MSEEQEKQCKTIQRKKNNPLVFPRPTNSGIHKGIVSFIFQNKLSYSEKESQYIIEISPDEQGKQQEHTYHLCPFEEFITRLTTSDNLVKQEQYMSTVESRNRQNIHKRKND